MSDFTHRKKRPAIVINVGDVFSGIEILEIEKGVDAVSTRYRVQYLCCDQVGWISHKPMTARKRGRGGVCRSCCARKQREQEEQRKQKKQITQVYVPGWGFTLGSFNRGR
jgi:hypothetical protein